MKHRSWVRLSQIILASSLALGLPLTNGCAKKRINAVEPIAAVPSVAADQLNKEADRRRAEEEKASRAREEKRRLEEERLRAERSAQKEEVAPEPLGGADVPSAGEADDRDRFLKEPIPFEYDKANLTSEAREILARKAKWLQANLNVSVIFEGHCDERGTTEYNMALGDRRAQSVKNYLIDLGVSGSRMTTISFGEEKPLDPGHDEAAWSKNRRVQPVIK